MKRIILTLGIILSIVSFTAFKAIEKPAETMENKGMPSEKRELLKRITGRWITQTNIYAREGKPASKVIGSDIWQWSPDGNFVLHTAYGIRDKSGFGAMEITGYNTKTSSFDSYNFHPDGNFSIGKLTINNNVWKWEGQDIQSSNKFVRTIGEFDATGKILTVTHEISADGKNYELFMDGVLTKGSDF